MMEEEERPVADRMDGVALPSETQTLLGHGDTLNGLCAAYAAGRLHHGVLLTGLRGSGKATLAFHLARHILAHPQPANAPAFYDDNAIPAAVRRQTANGAHPNLLHLSRPWMDKQRKFRTVITVDEVRRTHAFHGMTSGDGGWRVTIVDAADDLNIEAANALLKVLEEPPARCLFLVVSHNPGRLLPTIRSRCQTQILGTLNQADVLAAAEAARGEGADDGLRRAAAHSGGSVRRALQLAASGALDPYLAFNTLFEAGATGSAQDWKAASMVSNTLAGPANEERFALTHDLILTRLEQAVRERGRAAGELAGWAEVWNKAREARRLADEYNLDRRQLILDLFTDVFTQARRMRMPA